MNIPEANFGIVGVYRVHTVSANYSDGQFTMTLQSFRDTNTNVGKLWTILSTGEIEKESQKNQQPFHFKTILKRFQHNHNKQHPQPQRPPHQQMFEK